MQSYTSITNTQPYIYSAVAVGGNQVKVTFSEGLSTTSAAFIRVVNGSDKTSAGNLTAVGGFNKGDKEIIMQLDSGNYFLLGRTYVVYIGSSSNITDKAGIQFLKRTCLVRPKLKPPLRSPAHINPVIAFMYRVALERQPFCLLKKSRQTCKSLLKYIVR